MLETGVRAPGFQLCGLEGETHSLEQLLAGGPALLAFFKVSCPVCQFTLPFLERLHHGGGGRLQIVGVSQDKAPGTRSFNAEFGVTFPTLLDSAAENYPASNAFGIHTVPTLFLVERDGSISLASAGFSRRDLEEIGRRTGVAPFLPGERIPDYKPG
jgi:peroxiredoxin